MNFNMITSVISLFVGYLVNFFANGWAVLALALLSFALMIRVLYASLEVEPKKPKLYLVK